MAQAPGFFDVDERLKRLERSRRSVRGVHGGGRLRGVPAGAGGGAGLFGRRQGRPAAVRSGDDVQGAGDPDRQHAVGRTHRIPDQRSPLVHAVSRSRPVRPGAGRPHDLAVPREADQGRGDRALFDRFDATLRAAGYIAMSGQIVDATLVQAPRQRNTQGREGGYQGRPGAGGLESKPAKLRHKDRDARWTVKFTKAKPREDGTVPAVDLAIPGLRLPQPHRHRPPFRPDPHMAQHRCGRPRGNAGCAKGCSTRPTRPRRCGATRPIGPPPTRPSWPRTASCRASTARSRRTGRCPALCGAPTTPNPRSAPMSSTSSPQQKDRMDLFIRTDRLAQGDDQDRPRQPRLQRQTPHHPASPRIGVRKGWAIRPSIQRLAPRRARFQPQSAARGAPDRG